MTDGDLITSPDSVWCKKNYILDFSVPDGFWSSDGFFERVSG